MPRKKTSRARGFYLYLSDDAQLVVSGIDPARGRTGMGVSGFVSRAIVARHKQIERACAILRGISWDDKSRYPKDSPEAWALEMEQTEPLVRTLLRQRGYR